MRLPRVRITVGNLIAVVAIVALNCWVYRIVEKWDHYKYGDPTLWRLDAEEVVAFLPLLDVTAIGVCLTLRKRIRSRRSGTASENPSAFTFFCLHFLALGYLAFNFLPGTVAVVLEPMADLIRNGYQQLHERSLTVPRGVRDVLDHVALAVVVSGSLLILAGIGCLIARRVALKLSKRRFLALSSLVSGGLAAVGLTMVVTPRPFQDAREFEIVVRIVDSDSRQPIDRACVTLADAFRDSGFGMDLAAPPQTGVTDRNGLVRFRRRFAVCGERNAFQTSGAFSTWGRWLEVTANEHRTLRIPLPEPLGPDIDIDRIEARDIVLSRGPTPPDACSDVVGSYHTTYTGFGCSSFEIVPDGRFSWTASGCTFQTQEYGFVKRVGDAIEFVPVPKPVEETPSEIVFKYRKLQWGDCVYLIPTEPESIREFCLGGLTPERKRMPGDSYGGLIREGDEQKTPRGFPPLPLSAWVEFTLFETDLRNQDSDLRKTLESVIKQAFSRVSGETRLKDEAREIERSLGVREVVNVP